MLIPSPVKAATAATHTHPTVHLMLLLLLLLARPRRLSHSYLLLGAADRSLKHTHANTKLITGGERRWISSVSFQKVMFIKIVSHKRNNSPKNGTFTNKMNLKTCFQLFMMISNHYAVCGVTKIIERSQNVVCFACLIT